MHSVYEGAEDRDPFLFNRISPYRGPLEQHTSHFACFVLGRVGWVLSGCPQKNCVCLICFCDFLHNYSKSIIENAQHVYVRVRAKHETV